MSLNELSNELSKKNEDEIQNFLTRLVFQTFKAKYPVADKSILKKMRKVVNRTAESFNKLKVTE